MRASCAHEAKRPAAFNPWSGVRFTTKHGSYHGFMITRLNQQQGKNKSRMKTKNNNSKKTAVKKPAVKKTKKTVDRIRHQKVFGEFTVSSTIRALGKAGVKSAVLIVQPPPRSTLLPNTPL